MRQRTNFCPPGQRCRDRRSNLMRRRYPLIMVPLLRKPLALALLLLASPCDARSAVSSSCSTNGKCKGECCTSRRGLKMTDVPNSLRHVVLPAPRAVRLA